MKDPCKAIALVFLALVLITGCTRSQEPTILATVSKLAETSAAPGVTPQPSQTPAPTQTSTPIHTATPSFSPTPTRAVLIGAGDIAYCGSDPGTDGDEKTYALLKTLLAKEPNAAIFTAGDNVYGDGTMAELTRCFGATWGQLKGRIRPAVGNHEYQTDQAAPYFTYFGAAAGEAGKGYYSYDLGDWHITVLNSNCNDIACGPNSKQVQWLRQDLQSSTRKCTLMYWHHPRWSSGLSGSVGAVSTFWKTAYDLGVDVVVNGNDHDYERFSPMDGTGNPDPNGVREFVVGTGGAELRGWGTIAKNSEVRYSGTYGVIQFTLYPDQYEWLFIPTDDAALTDTGTGTCH